MNTYENITAAENILMEYSPLHAFIAVNPLWSYRNKDFFSTISNPIIAGLMSTQYYTTCFQNNLITIEDISNAIKIIDKKSLGNSEIKQWLAQSNDSHKNPTEQTLVAEQIDEYEFQKPTEYIKKHIYTLLNDYFGSGIYKKASLLEFWRQNSFINKKNTAHFNSMTTSKAISHLLSELKIPQETISSYLEKIYSHTYGWSSLMKWRNNHPNNHWLPGKTDCASILLIWLSYEHHITQNLNNTYQYKKYNASSHSTKSLKNRYIWHTAYELNYINRLASNLNVDISNHKIQHDAQFIFCIDTRSESFRRHLEAQGKIESFGFAGFFGAIFNLNNHGKVSYQAPALVEAKHTFEATEKRSIFSQLIHHLKKTISSTKKQLTAPLALYEMVGYFFLPFMIFKAIRPKLKITIKKPKPLIKSTFSNEEKLQAAKNLLTSIGLVENFSPTVLICAHQSDNVNNPFKSSLNCGACGGNSGIPNAIVICDILNNQAIRLKLQACHIHIPKETTFIPACHHTGADRLDILNGQIPHSLQEKINQAAKLLRQEKIGTLPGRATLAERESNWSELIPELGLINNASMIIGPRALTAGKNLERRAFLHSYDPNTDKKGDILTSILSAPAIVAHWINSQYYFSTVDPAQFGAGNKAIHNVIPGIGVLEGNLSDLKIGLPLQSTHFRSKPIHEPRRIVIVVYAKKRILDQAIADSPNFKLLLSNQWLHLKHIEPNPSTKQED